MNSKKALSSLKSFLESQDEQYDSQANNAELYAAIETIEINLVGSGSDSLFVSDRPNDCEKRCREIIKNKSLSAAFPPGVFACFKRNWQILIVFLKKKPWKNSESKDSEGDIPNGQKKEAKPTGDLEKQDGATDEAKLDRDAVTLSNSDETLEQPTEESKTKNLGEESLSTIWKEANSKLEIFGQDDKPCIFDNSESAETTPVVVDICSDQVYFRTKNSDGDLIDSPSYYFDDESKEILPEDSKGFYGTQASYSLFSSLFYKKGCR